MNTSSSTAAVNPIDSLIFSVADSNVHSLIKGAALGIALQGVLLGMIYSHSYRYFQIFNDSDPRLYRALVGVGIVVNTAQMVMCIWQTLFLIDHDHNITSVFHTDVACNMLICLWIAITNAFTASYFYRRAWSLAGRKWWLLIPAIAAILASLGLGCAVVSYGFQMPRTKTLSDLNLLLKWYKKIGRVAKAWAVLSFSIDVVVCVSMFIFLAATQNELKKEHNRPLLRRMYIVTSETMLPPALLALGIFISFELHGVTLLSMDRAMFWMMSDMLFLAVLHSLVARQRLATVIFAPNRSGGEAQDSTELRRVGNLDYKEAYNAEPSQHERTLSYDSVRKSWIPVLTHNMEQRGEIDAEDTEALVPNRSSTTYAREGHDGAGEAFQIPTPLAVAMQLPTTDREKRRWQGQSTVSPYGYPLADR